jgi:glycosidase
MSEKPPANPTFHFHIAAKARNKYRFPGELFAMSGNVIFADLHAVRLFTQKMNDERRAAGDTRALRAGDMNAMGLIDEVLHYVSRLYVKQAAPLVFGKALAFVNDQLGAEAVDRALLRFLEEFPPREVFAGKRTVEEFLQGVDGETPNREIVIEELLHLWLANVNPAFGPFCELFDQVDVASLREHGEMLKALGDFFRSQPVFGPDNQDLVALLRAPAVAAPRSLTGQLEYIRSRWGHLLGDLLLKLLMGIDLIKEEERLRFAFFKPGLPEVYEYGGQYAEPEAFSADKDWMPKVVMLAKNALVWLDQLSRRSGRAITRLDQVPDEELDRLARWGVTALWLIGVWERSRASRRIKRTMGNPEAEASAYSLFDYQVAAELGGEEALANLRGRAWRRGIRLASDMVPNHTGIDSRWMIEHPDRFLAYPRPYPPFPSYSFNGSNLVDDPRVGVFLEDHYYTRSDAAVVFKRVDFATGDARYIYHGNDGTHMPWNDTAQLDFLNPETREAVIRTILHVASLFPIIRFDAAMTLTKRHYQRLWFPEPGRGGDIPSRAECGLSRFDFDHAMPNEFWREVVDRVAAEAPDTLLLAEAFWLLEGFFVRTLGMHRVYNSAFMNMLKAEENANYRQTIKNTMEFDPEVLKRFVNFMSNPDEDTAIAQFGDGDKYFGVCTLMATMPGLPMFAHGQVEGLREKYGMEFRHAYWNESPNEGFIRRHEREIFPLLKKRYLFCGVDAFQLYDFFDTGGWVNEDVFAYSNRSGGERALVVYNNAYREARGWIRTSAAFSVKGPGGKTLVQRHLGEGLALSNSERAFAVFREHSSGLEFMRSCRELREKGMFVELHAYQSQVFLDFREVGDDSKGRWSRLCGELAGQGVPSIDIAFREMELRPVLSPFRSLVNADTCRELLSAVGEKEGAAKKGAAGKATKAGASKKTTKPPAADKRKTATEGDAKRLLAEIEGRYRGFLAGVKELAPDAVDQERSFSEFERLLPAIGAAGEELLSKVFPALWAWAVLEPIRAPRPAENAGPVAGGAKAARDAGSIAGGAKAAGEGRPGAAGCPAVSWLDEWMLGAVIRDCCSAAAWDGETASRAQALVSVLLESGGRRPTASELKRLSARQETEGFLRVHSSEGTRWFHKESLDLLLGGLSACGLAAGAAAGTTSPAEALKKDRAFIASCLTKAEESGYKWDAFLQSLVERPKKTLPSAGTARGKPASGGRARKKV